MKFNFPEIKFAKENCIQDQYEHVRSEEFEAEEEYLWHGNLSDKFFEEMADLTHSIETFWRIVERTKGKPYLDNLFSSIVRKNVERNYYEVRSQPIDNERN